MGHFGECCRMNIWDVNMGCEYIYFSCIYVLDDICFY